MGNFVLKELNRKEMGRRVRVRRDFLGLSRDELAEMVNLSPQFLSDIEYGKKGMSINTLFALSQALEISADYFLAGKADDPADDTTSRFREEIDSMLDSFSADQLEGVSGIIRIYEDRTRMK